MSALRAVEQVHALLLLRRGSVHIALVGVGLGVDNARRLAEHADADAMPKTDLVEVIRTRLSSWCSTVAYEEGAGGGDQDVAVGFVSTMRFGVRGGSLDSCAYPYSWGIDAMTDMVEVLDLCKW